MQGRDEGCAWPGGGASMEGSWQGEGHAWQRGMHDMHPRADTTATAYGQ